MQYVHKLGVSAKWKFVDVYDMSAEGLQSVPHPVAAALFLFPLAPSPQVDHWRLCRMASVAMWLSSSGTLSLLWLYVLRVSCCLLSIFAKCCHCCVARLIILPALRLIFRDHVRQLSIIVLFQTT